jgi:DNA-directed RNA polymerase specialized sigma24 family protein
MDKPLDGAERVWTEFLSALDTLPPTTRAVFLLHALFDASFEDIERTLGVRRDACRRHLEAARHAMHTLKGDNP